ncbi:MAG: LysE family transporter [Proteobacteria bacterium]|nr:LysE family transporter [Pseudomonadota bacterium]
MGLVLGVGGGLSPGPLTALVVAETLRGGTRAGMTVAITPLITDTPLLIVTGLAAGLVSRIPLLEAGIGLVGAAFLVYLAWDTARAAGISTDGASPGSLKKAVLTNVLNPHPYVFWLAVGGPLVAEAWTEGAPSLAAFLLGFFGGIVGAKAIVAALLGRFRHLFTGAPYRWTMRALAVGMLVLAGRFAYGGLSTSGFLG